MFTMHFDSTGSAWVGSLVRYIRSGGVGKGKSIKALIELLLLAEGNQRERETEIAMLINAKTKSN